MRPLLLAALASLVASSCTREGADSPPAAAAAKASPAPAPFRCVHFADLARHLPRAVAGYERVQSEGSSGKYGAVTISEAERVFSNPDGHEISVRIVDTTLVDELGERIRAGAEDATAGAEGPSAALVGEGSVGFVRYDPSRRRAEANLLVADRFVVAVTTTGPDGTGAARQVANSIDLAGLALLRPDRP